MDDLDRALSEAVELANLGLLTERQAQAVALRDVYSFDRETAAEAMGVSESRLDDARRDAHAKISSAKTTVHKWEKMHERADIDLTTCTECGDEMDEYTFERGRPVCLDCAG